LIFADRDQIINLSGDKDEEGEEEEEEEVKEKFCDKENNCDRLFRL